MPDWTWDDLLAVIAAVPERGISALAGGLYQVAHEIMVESMPLVPFDLGALEASGVVSEPEVQDLSATVELGYGGPAIQYAIVQHEHLEYRHAPGRQAKYLEEPVLAAAGGLEQSLAERFETLMERDSELDGGPAV